MAWYNHKVTRNYSNQAMRGMGKKVLSNQAMRGMGKGDVLNRKISIWRFSPRLLVGYSERTGNIDLYTRERSYVRLGMTAEF